MSASYSDDRHGMMRVHIADERAQLACAKFSRAALRERAKANGVTLRASLNKRDLAWYMAQHGLIDADGNLRDGFPSVVSGRDWHASNFEGHAPSAAPWGASGRFVPACNDGCIDPEADGVLAHLERDDAIAQAAHILAGRVHGPTDTETR